MDRLNHIHLDEVEDDFGPSTSKEIKDTKTMKHRLSDLMQTLSVSPLEMDRLSIMNEDEKLENESFLLAASKPLQLKIFMHLNYEL